MGIVSVRKIDRYAVVYRGLGSLSYSTCHIGIKASITPSEMILALSKIGVFGVE